MKKQFDIVSFGEILWDIFPDGKALGGAPLNVGLRLLSLEAKLTMISRLGTDALAEETLAALDKYDLPQEFIQEDENLETGQVLVTLDKTGSASYEIKQPVAWDNIELTEANKNRVAEADCFIFGSLAARSESSRNTLKELLAVSKKAVFDVNFRAPHYKMAEIVQLMKQVQFVKMNEEELTEIKKFLDIKSQTMEDCLKEISKQTETPTICVTCGDAGAVLWQNNHLYSHSGYSTKVIDTVGAGDSFLAGLLYKLNEDVNKPEQALAFGCALGALVAGFKGANPEISMETIQKKMDSQD
ncbi:MAG: carbohydrate kinase [Leeuwenhoekiella sp.]